MIAGPIVPKTIYSFWHQGRDEAPAVVQLCLERWEKLNPDYNVCLIDRGNVAELLKDFPLRPDQMPVQALSDVIRARLLVENGGVWVDATVFPIHPLSAWLYQVTKQGFFAFEKPAEDRPLASWFLAASPEHRIMQRWWDEIVKYWSKPRRLLIDPRDGDPVPSNPLWEVSPDGGSRGDSYPYFWFHYLFKLLIETDSEIAEIWRCCPKVSATPSHMLQYLLATGSRVPLAQILEAAKSVPVQKLNWRHIYPLEHLRNLSLPASESAGRLK